MFRVKPYHLFLLAIGLIAALYFGGNRKAPDKVAVAQQPAEKGAETMGPAAEAIDFMAYTRSAKERLNATDRKKLEDLETKASGEKDVLPVKDLAEFWESKNELNMAASYYKKAAFLQGGKNDPDFKIGLEDYESVIHLKSNGLNGVAIPEILFNYRVRKNSMIKKSTREVRGQYYIEIVKKHPSLFKAFHKEIEVLNGFKAPLTFDNATLDDFPFQHVPILNSAVRKAIKIVKSSPALKNAALFLKKCLKK